METSSQRIRIRVNDIWRCTSLCTHNDMTTPLPRCSMLACARYSWFCVIYVVRSPSRSAPPCASTLNVRGMGGSRLELLRENLREWTLRTFFHQQSPHTWSCIALWHERATDMCAHTTRDVPIQHEIGGRLIHRSSPATFARSSVRSSQAALRNRSSPLAHGHALHCGMSARQICVPIRHDV